MSKLFIPRLLKLPKNKSFFLFGARNTGKSTLIKKTFHSDSTLFIDLLNPEWEERLSKRPNDLISIVELLDKLDDKIHYVVIDEVQKIPKLLDCVHYLIENTKKHFILTGSSARQLKAKGVNLLAGRALIYHLHPFSFLEIEDNFDLKKHLEFGSLPSTHFLKSKEEQIQFLQSYAQTYLKEEIWYEHLIRKLSPFRKFLEVAAQSNGTMVNFSNIARDVKSDDKTIKNYYSILEDTMVGFFIDGFNHSFRKRLSTKPKFYFFDTGITRALSNTLSIELLPKTTAYGNAFEQFIILECIKLASYYDSETRFSYIRTKDDVEIDLVIERPGKPFIFVEIKSSDEITEQSISPLIKISKEFKNSIAICLCNEPFDKQIEHVQILNWKNGLKKLFLT